MNITIQAAAIKFNDGTIKVGPTHARILEVLPYADECQQPGSLQNMKDGFLTSEGKFVDRCEAAIIAFNAKQIKEPVGFLYSYMID